MAPTSDNRQEVIRYYEDTGLDYAEWSREYNMHFGYWRLPMNPLRREPMLDEMNQRVFAELELRKDALIHLVEHRLAPQRVHRQAPVTEMHVVLAAPLRVVEACVLVVADYFLSVVRSGSHVSRE